MVTIHSPVRVYKLYKVGLKQQNSNYYLLKLLQPICMELDLKRLAYLLYGSVASLPSPSSHIEAWPYDSTSLRFASLLHLGH